MIENYVEETMKGFTEDWSNSISAVVNNKFPLLAVVVQGISTATLTYFDGEELSEFWVTGDDNVSFDPDTETWTVLCGEDSDKELTVTMLMPKRYLVL